MRQKQRVFSLFLLSPSSRRAWIEITMIQPTKSQLEKSPSSRRAWIEMLKNQIPAQLTLVALLAEGVDRNFAERHKDHYTVSSPSSRRAWIEIA